MVQANALVMAASRKGARDPVAQMQNKSHKCLVEIDGEVMLVRVINALFDSGHVGTVYVSIEGEEPLRTVPRLAQWLDEGRVKVATSEGNLADSVLAGAEQMTDPFPFLITTGDNALHTAELIREFMAAFWTLDGDVALGFTSEAVVAKEIPDSGLAYHRLKDGGYSSCNLYGMRREKALNGVRVFASGGQFGKRHLRILKAFGVMPFILYKLRAVGIHKMANWLGRGVGVTVDIVDLPYAFGPIDVDNPRSFALSERLLQARRHKAPA
jgi:GTP:adenosylcobinamide-phosphate guanylyltransferase